MVQLKIIVVSAVGFVELLASLGSSMFFQHAMSGSEMVCSKHAGTCDLLMIRVIRLDSAPSTYIGNNRRIMQDISSTYYVCIYICVCVSYNCIYIYMFQHDEL